MTHRHQLHAGDKAKLIQIVSLFLLMLGILTVCARLGTKYVLKRRFRLDDKLIVIAVVILTAQTVSVLIAASQGLGTIEIELTEEVIDNTLKAEYISIPLLIAGLAVIKWSLLELIYHISPNYIHRRAAVVIAVLVGIWLVSAIIASLFQCAMPTPWHHFGGSLCFDRKAWWTYVVVVNIVTEFNIVGLYISIVRPLQVSLLRKTAILAVFSARLLVVAAALVQLVAFYAEGEATDMTYSLWFPTLSNQVLAAVSVVTACLPYLKPCLEGLETNVIGIRGDIFKLEESDYEVRAGNDALALHVLDVPSVDADFRNLGHFEI